MRSIGGPALSRGAMILSILMAVFFCVVTTSGEQKHHPSTLSGYMDVLCPYNVICREGEPRLPPPASDRTGCCTDCSCSETCGLTETCCYPSLDNYNLVDRSHQQCIYAATVTPDHGIGYNMVADKYPNGSGGDCYGSFNVSCGENNDATVLGAMYPVFSHRTGRIYKNIRCAKCHGLNERDILRWEVYLACEKMNYEDASTYFRFFEDGKMMPSCHFRFIYPGPVSDLETEHCYPEYIQKCSADDEFYVPDELNMTRHEVRVACNSHLRSPVFRGVWYKNIFCRLCNKITANPQKHKINPLITCRRNLLNYQEKLLESSFKVLIEPGPMEKRTLSDSREHLDHQRIACKMMKNNKTVCRRAYCPSGRTSLEKGSCRYLAKQWKTIVDIHLKLFPKQIIKASTLRNRNFNQVLANTSLSVSPWSNDWKIELFMYKSIMGKENVSIVDYFFARLVHKPKRLNVKRVIASVELSMKKEWLFYLDDTLVSHRQEFSEYTNIVHNERFSEPVTYTFGYAAPGFISNLTLPIFHRLFEVNAKENRVTITKMFFCYQVLLRPNEYLFDYKVKLLYQKSTGRIFCHGEIAVAYDEKLIYVPRLCLDDAGFHLVSSEASGRWLSLTLAVLIAYIYVFCNQFRSRLGSE